MLHLLYGPAASGKTDLLMGRIRTAVAARTPGQVLLMVPGYLSTAYALGLHPADGVILAEASARCAPPAATS